MPNIDTLYTIASDSTYTVSPGLQSTSFGVMMFQMIGVLLVLSIILYLFLYYVKKLNLKYKNQNEFLRFKLIENFYFSQKQGLSSVLFGNKLYIIGFSNNSISVIDIIEDKETIAKLTEKEANPAKFSNIFMNLFRKGK